MCTEYAYRIYKSVAILRDPDVTKGIETKTELSTLAPLENRKVYYFYNDFFGAYVSVRSKILTFPVDSFVLVLMSLLTPWSRGIATLYKQTIK